MVFLGIFFVYCAQVIILFNMVYTQLEDDEKRNSTCCSCLCCIPRRWFTVVMVFLGIFFVYCARVNLSVAIEPMSCEFNWSSKTQGLVLSSFFWGYIVMQVPGGWLASTPLGAKTIFGISVIGTAVMTMLVPLVTSGRIDGGTPTLDCVCDSSVADGWCFREGVYIQNGDCSLISPTKICGSEYK